MEKILPSSHRKALDVKISGLRFLGFWSPKSSASPCIRFFYYINNILAIFFFSFYTATLVVDVIVNKKNSSVALEGILYVFSTLMVGFKSYKFASEHPRIADLTEAILQPLDVLSKSTDSNIKQLIKINVLNEFIIDISFGSMVVLFDIGTLMLAFSNGPDLPVRGVFPFDTTISPNHEYAIILQAIMINVCFSMVVLTDEFIFSLVRWITVQLAILNCNYQNCYIPDKPDTSKSIIRTNSLEEFKYVKVDDFLFKLRTCSKNHQHLIKLMSEWNSIFNSIMFIEISTSCIMICLTSVQLVMDRSNMAVTVKFALFCGSAATQLLIWCWLGNELTSQSESVSSGLWSCGWENYLKHYQIKSLMEISLMQGICPFQMEAGKFFVMSMETYIKVMKTAYSFFALLSAVN